MKFGHSTQPGEWRSEQIDRISMTETELRMLQRLDGAGIYRIGNLVITVLPDTQLGAITHVAASDQ